MEKYEQFDISMAKIKKIEKELIELGNKENISLMEVDFGESKKSRQDYIFIKGIQEILKDLGDKINQSDLMKETKVMRESLGLGDKRTIKWLQTWAARGKWKCEKVASEKNSIFYWIDEQTAKLAKVPNTDKIGA